MPAAKRPLAPQQVTGLKIPKASFSAESLEATPNFFLEKFELEDMTNLIRDDPCGSPVATMCKKVIPYVDQFLFEKIKSGEFEENLPGISADFKKGGTLATMTPLRITSSSQLKNGMLTTYKLTFDIETASNSLDTTGMFEGCISLFALDPEPVQGSDAYAIAGVSAITWAGLNDLSRIFDVVQPCVASVGDQIKQVKRTIFPVILPVTLKSNEGLIMARKPLLTGHQWVLAWYLSCFKEIKRSHTSDVLRLLQCALTPTIQIRTGLSLAQQAVWSIQMSEQKDQEVATVDSFIVWAGKVWVAIGLTSSLPRPTLNQTAKLKAISSLNLTFRHMALNKAMVAAAEKVMDPNKVNAESLDVLKLIDARHGREIFSTGYVKLKKLVDICEKEAGMNNDTVAPYVQYALEYLNTAGASKYIKLARVTAESLEYGKDGKSNGLVVRALSQRELIQNVIKGWILDLPDHTDFATMKAELLAVVADFGTHMKVYSKFSEPGKQGAPSSAAPLGESMGAYQDADETPFEAYNKNLGNKIASICAEACYDIMSGQFDSQLDKILAERQDSTPLGSVQWTLADHKLDGLRELERSLCLHKSCVSTTSSDQGPPAAGKRELKRMYSEAKDEDEKTVQEKERAQTRARAQSERRKYVKVVFYGAGNMEKMVAMFCDKEDTLAAGSEYRMVHFAADSWWEPEQTPWRSPASCAEEIKPIVETMLNHKKPTDVIMVHDGRSRTVRRMLDNVFQEKASHFADVWITYNPGACQGRKVFLGADNREVMFCELPTSRTLWAVEDVSDFTGAGEVDTHANTITGVKPLMWWNMPLISASDKAKVLGHAVVNPPRKFYDATMGQPLLWNERKSAAYYVAIMKRFKIKKVLCFSAGGGELPRACLEQGIACTVVCRNQEHCSWIQNVLDRAALVAIATKQTTLYDAEMKDSIERLFQDVIECLHAQDKDNTCMPTRETMDE